MRALCLITIKPSTADKVVKILKKKRKIIREIMVVTGRADISVVLQGPRNEINKSVNDFKKITGQKPTIYIKERGRFIARAGLSHYA